MHSFCKKGMKSKQIKNPLKTLFRPPDLCYSIGEAYGTRTGHNTRSASAWTNWRNIPANDSFNIGWRHITKKELSANMDSDSEICFISIFAVGFMKDYVRGNQFGKVVHDESGKDLLVYVLHLSCVEMK